MKEQITFDIFDKVDIRVGTVISVKKNEKARKPSLVVEVDFGKEIGIKQSSAQITHYYNEDNLKGKQVIGVCNFPEKNISYSIQHEQKGISHALMCAKEYIYPGDTVFFILGDNFFEHSPTANLNLENIYKI